LARWHAMKSYEEKGQFVERRPYLSTLCETLPECEKWRMQIIREIAKKVSQIQNAGLGEFKLRDLNDEINKLLREKVSQFCLFVINKTKCRIKLKFGVCVS